MKDVNEKSVSRSHKDEMIQRLAACDSVVGLLTAEITAKSALNQLSSYIGFLSNASADASYT